MMYISIIINDNSHMKKRQLLLFLDIIMYFIIKRKILKFYPKNSTINKLNSGILLSFIFLLIAISKIVTQHEILFIGYIVLSIFTFMIIIDRYRNIHDRIIILKDKGIEIKKQKNKIIIFYNQIVTLEIKQKMFLKGDVVFINLRNNESIQLIGIEDVNKFCEEIKKRV